MPFLLRAFVSLFRFDDCLLHGVIRLAITFFAVYRIKMLKH